ncbi:MAG: malate dehydrogenase [Spirochaetia bacterium]|nr:malate dehydrogenase [Spirochaetota bacterium]MCX8096170.1 malate dehydrogenase [Spirochaetota bacterium]MDW8113012.1 malate dehydrogenase [Spirochaetia bacterium]
MKKLKVTVVGAGNVGGTVANIISQRGYADVVLIDIDGDIAKGKAIDIQQQLAISNSDARIIGGSDYSLTEGSDISVITAGFPRKPGMKREELLEANSKVVKTVTENLIKHSPNTYIIVVTNPVDAMSYLAFKVSGFSRNKVLGMGGVLDTARLKYYIKQKLNVSYNSINAIVIGGHGDEMVPVMSSTTVSGKPITSILNKEEIEEIINKTKNGGAEIVSLLKTGSAYYAPGMAVVRMIESIVFDRKEVLPSSVFCQGEYGIDGIFFGLPVVLGINGLEKIVEVILSEEEKEMFKRSVQSVKNTIEVMNKLPI